MAMIDMKIRGPGARKLQRKPPPSSIDEADRTNLELQRATQQMASSRGITGPDWRFLLESTFEAARELIRARLKK